MPAWSPFPSWFRMMFLSGGPADICYGAIAGMGDIICDVIQQCGTVMVGTNLLGGVQHEVQDMVGLGDVAHHLPWA